MPVKSFRVSSLSEEVIPDGSGARIRVIWADQERTDMRADLTDAETDDLIKRFKLEQVEERPAARKRMRL